MPKISPARAQKRSRALEDAALRLFLRRGYNGVGLRTIAKEAKVSLGNVYNYYSGKGPLYRSILERLYSDFTAVTVPLARYLLNSRFPDDLTEFGKVMEQMVEQHRDYLTLVYVDIAEFDGENVRPHYEDLVQRFRLALGPRLDELRDEGRLAAWADPALAFTLLYMQFANYFIVERLIGARRHLGLSDPDAVQAISKLFVLGLAARPETSTKE